jgi:hypothetical protein
MQRCTHVARKSFYSWRTQQLAPGLLPGIRSSHTNAPAAFTCAPSTLLLTVKTQPRSKKNAEQSDKCYTWVRWQGRSGPIQALVQGHPREGLR